MCDNNCNGCKWVGELCSLQKHSASCCFTLLPCPNECHEAGEVLQLFRKDLEKHTSNECPRRQYQCPHCQEEGEYQQMTTTTHLQICPMKKVPCPNQGCNARIARCDLSCHRRQCLFEKVSCKYATIGCEQNMIRKDLKKHESDAQQHLQLAVDTVHKQQDRISQLERLLSKEMPMIYKFTNYKQYKTSNETVYTPGFYTGPGGYKLCISLRAHGNGKDKNTHFAVFAHLMKGENDDLLPWPFTGRVTFELLNQLEDKNHCSESSKFRSGNDVSQRVVDGERSSTGWGKPYYISNSDLGYNPAKNCQYLKDDCLYFRFRAEANSSSKPWLVQSAN